MAHNNLNEDWQLPSSTMMLNICGLQTISFGNVFLVGGQARLGELGCDMWYVDSPCPHPVMECAYVLQSATRERGLLIPLSHQSTQTD